MTTPPAPTVQTWTPEALRLHRIFTLLSPLALALPVVMALPFRVADCGPADPLLLRYLGTPFLHMTGSGVSSSMEWRLWPGPLLANIACVGAFIAGLATLLGRRARFRGRVPHIQALRLRAVLSVFLLAAGGLLLLSSADLQWTLFGPDLDPATCDIRFDWRPDPSAWQSPRV